MNRDKQIRLGQRHFYKDFHDVLIGEESQLEKNLHDTVGAIGAVVNSRWPHHTAGDADGLREGEEEEKKKRKSLRDKQVLNQSILERGRRGGVVCLSLRVRVLGTTRA